MDKKAIKKKRKLVLVKWLDIVSVTNCNVKEVLERKFPSSETVGFLLENSKDRIVLLMSKDPDEDGETNDIMIIPKRPIKVIENLKEGRIKKGD